MTSKNLYRIFKNFNRRFDDDSSEVDHYIYLEEFKSSKDMILDDN